MKKRLSSMILMLALCLGLAAPALAAEETGIPPKEAGIVLGSRTVLASNAAAREASADFTDVSAGQWYAAAVSWAVENKITNGTSDDTFSPEQKCTQAQVLTFLYRAAHGYGVATADDMAAAITWGRRMDIIDSSFNGNKACTRATAIVYIWQALGRSSARSASFTDVPARADYAAAVAWALENGVTNGISSTTFRPNDICSRGEIVTFLHRAYVPSARLTAE